MTKYLLFAVACFLATSMCASCISNAADASPIFEGRAVANVETEEIVATLEAFSPERGEMYSDDAGIVFDVSKFVIVSPEQYRGQKFSISHYFEPADLVAWREVGKTYVMIVHKDILAPPKGEIFFPGPEYVSIIEEVRADKGPD